MMQRENDRNAVKPFTYEGPDIYDIHSRMNLVNRDQNITPVGLMSPKNLETEVEEDE